LFSLTFGKRNEAQLKKYLTISPRKPSIQMPLLTHKRRGRRRRGADRASLVDSSEDGIGTNSCDEGASPSGSTDEPAYESRYHEIVASRLGRLELPAGAGAGDEDGSDFPDLPSLPSSEILEALTRKSFHDNESRAALLEYQCHNLLTETRGPDIQGLDTDSGESEPDDLIRDEKYDECRQVLGARMADIDTYTELDQEQTNKLHLKYALYRIKAALVSLI
jgi:hypothetical protein